MSKFSIQIELELEVVDSNLHLPVPSMKEAQSMMNNDKVISVMAKWSLCWIASIFNISKPSCSFHYKVIFNLNARFD
jgi:hypothetical protein